MAMPVSAWQILIVLAAGLSFATATGRVSIGDNDAAGELVGGVASVVMWVVVAFGALNLRSTAGQVESSPAIAWLAVGLAGVMLVVTLVGATAIVNVLSRGSGGRSSSGRGRS